MSRKDKKEVLIDEKLNIYASETAIRIEKEGDTMICKLGVMLKIDNKWKTFSDPWF